MKTLLALVLLALSAPALATDTEDLASAPEAYVEDGVCHIHGAIWSGAPVPNAYLNLVEIGGDGVYEARTDHRGEYQVSIPVASRVGFKAVFKEAPHRRSPYAVRRARWSSPKVECRSASVEVGPLVPVR